MTREVKYRIWENGEMCYAPTLFKKQLTDGSVLQQAMHFAWTREDSFELPLMQYTGCTDKNGIQIYSGDIVKIYHCEDDPETAVVSKVDSYGDVEWPDIPDTYADAGALRYIYDECVIEVLGNEYDNPELLLKG